MESKLALAAILPTALRANSLDEILACDAKFTIMSRLRTWRQENKLSLNALGEMLGLGGRNRARTIQRIETGESLCDADLARAIEAVTAGAVTPADMHQTRLAWLEDNSRARPFERTEQPGV